MLVFFHPNPTPTVLLVQSENLVSYLRNIVIIFWLVHYTYYFLAKIFFSCRVALFLGCEKIVIQKLQKLQIARTLSLLQICTTLGMPGPKLRYFERDTTFLIIVDFEKAFSGR